MNIILENLTIRKKLKLIKNNNNLVSKLEITIKDYKNYFFDEMETKYIIKLKNIYELDIIDNQKGYNNLNHLNKLKYINKLYLGSNNIANIPKIYFENLEILNLSNNYINNIEELKNINYKNLKELYLENNLIEDINVLEQVKFNQLEILSLTDNVIS